MSTENDAGSTTTPEAPDAGSAAAPSNTELAGQAAMGSAAAMTSLASGDAGAAAGMAGGLVGGIAGGTAGAAVGLGVGVVGTLIDKAISGQGLGVGGSGPVGGAGVSPSAPASSPGFSGGGDPPGFVSSAGPAPAAPSAVGAPDLIGALDPNKPPPPLDVTGTQRALQQAPSRGAVGGKHGLSSAGKAAGAGVVAGAIGAISGGTAAATGSVSVAGDLSTAPATGVPAPASAVPVTSALPLAPEAVAEGASSPMMPVAAITGKSSVAESLQHVKKGWIDAAVKGGVAADAGLQASPSTPGIAGGSPGAPPPVGAGLDLKKALGAALSGAAAGVSGAVAQVASPVMKAASDAMAAASAAAGIGGKLTETPGMAPGPDLPFFEEKAITAAVPEAVSELLDQAKGALEQASSWVGSKLGGKNLEVEIGSGDKLDVRNFAVQERMSSLFSVHIIAVSDNASIDFDSVVGLPAKFSMHAGTHDRAWSGICNHIEQVRVEPDGMSTYQLSIVPALWFLTQRKNHRMFQHLSEKDIVLKMLKEWEIEPELRIDKGAYKKRKYRVQYAESDFAFVSRMLEDCGISYFFEQDGEETKLVLSDAPQSSPKRKGDLAFSDDTSMVKKNDNDVVTDIRMGQRVRPGKVTLRDHDYRRPPSYKLMTSAASGLAPESKLERFHYTPGLFLFGADQGDATPVADDKGKTRTDEKEGALLAQKRLDAKRGSARICTFATNAHDLTVGMVISISGHPHEALGEGKKWLIIESAVSGTATGEWSHHCEARSTEVPCRPEPVTPRPKVNGVESATVVGPKGEEIHTDEFGRVRVHFHWDRESKMDEASSCWIHVNEGWAGAGYGMIHIPRIGQEVLVDFLGGDPDRPIIVGRVYTNLQKVPYKLPQDKTKSGWKSNSTGGGGGYNEIMFEDAEGKELVNIQAQKDLNKLVKNNETENTGVNRTISVGQNRSASIGANDSAMVGVQHSVTIAGPDGSGVTSVTMSHQSIVLTTGGATISMGPDTISLQAREVAIVTAEDTLIQADAQVVIDGAEAVLINCTEQPPPDEVEMPSTEDEFVDEVISLIPFGRVVELGAKLVLGESTVDGWKSTAAGGVRSAADTVRGTFTGGAQSSGFDGGHSGGGKGGGGSGTW